MKAYIIQHNGFDFGPAYYRGYGGQFGPVNQAKLYHSLGALKNALRHVSNRRVYESFDVMDRKFSVIEIDLPDVSSLPRITPSSLWDKE